MKLNGSWGLGEYFMHKEKLIILVVALVVLAGFLYWFFALRGEVAVPEPEEVQEVGLSDESETKSLGEQLLEKAQNPVKGAVPELETVVNPVEGLYKNPFE